MVHPDSAGLTPGEQAVANWFSQRGWQPFPFQRACMSAYLGGQSGLLNAPTGSGKTLALWLPCLAAFINQQQSGNQQKKSSHLHILWITPLRALTKDTHRAMSQACEELGVPWQVAVRTGDTSGKEKEQQKKRLPECLITTPESLHLMLAQKSYAALFEQLDAVIIDEWHELLGTKRGVQCELALTRLRALRPKLRVWGISATIGNLAEAAQVLIPHDANRRIVRAHHQKKIEVTSLLPHNTERFPWAGHLGTNLIPTLLPIIERSATTLLFTNTRAQTEIWYQQLLDKAPHLAGLIAMHHGSMDRELRDWVENAIHEQKLKVVVCTSSLDLGVDFRPVETVIQVGSPKGVARFLQRAGRSGHQPGATSRIFFLPTHALELIEGAALRHAVEQATTLHEDGLIESRPPLRLPTDVLVQYLVTLAISDGFDEQALYQEVRQSFAFQELGPEEWNWCLQFICSGGESLDAYQEFSKVERNGSFYYVNSRKVAMRHRLSIGTIVSEPMVQVRLLRGGYVGTVEEYFISRLKRGDTFFFAGRNLELVSIDKLTAFVRKSDKKTGQVPRWMGSRMPLSSELAGLLRQKLAEHETSADVEMQAIRPILDLQKQWSVLPAPDELLIEQVRSQEGYHVFIYPFEGRLVHEVMASVIAFRISQIEPITFSMAMNDYGFELLSDRDIPLLYALEADLFNPENLLEDVERSLNNSEMARRRFREIAAIAGLVFQGFPGKNVKSKHLQASTQLLFDVFVEYDPENLLVRQAYREVMDVQMEQQRLEKAFRKIQRQRIVLKQPPRPTPFAFPIMVDRLRNRLSSESIEDRVQRMQLQLERYADQA